MRDRPDQTEHLTLSEPSTYKRQSGEVPKSQVFDARFLGHVLIPIMASIDTIPPTALSMVCMGEIPPGDFTGRINRNIIQPECLSPYLSNEK